MLKIPYAIEKIGNDNGRSYTPTEFRNYLNVKTIKSEKIVYCTCCEQEVFLKNSHKGRAFFSHYPNSNSPCSNEKNEDTRMETTLHKRAKDYFQKIVDENKEGCLKIIAVDKFFPPYEFHYDKVYKERRIKTDDGEYFIPDVILENSKTNQRISIEIKVTHKGTVKKDKKQFDTNLITIEIELNLKELENKTGEELDEILEKLLNSDLEVKYKHLEKEQIARFFYKEKEKYDKKQEKYDKEEKNIEKNIDSLNKLQEIYEDLLFVKNQSPNKEGLTFEDYSKELNDDKQFYEHIITQLKNIYELLTNLKKTELTNNEVLTNLRYLNELIIDKNIPKFDSLNLKEIANKITQRINSIINDNKKLDNSLSTEKLDNNKQIQVLNSKIDLIETNELGKLQISKQKEIDEINKEIKECEQTIEQSEDEIKKYENELKTLTDSSKIRIKERQIKYRKEIIIPKNQAKKFQLYEKLLEKEKELEIINKNINKENNSSEYNTLIEERESLINKNKEIDKKLKKCNYCITYFNKDNTELVNLRDIIINLIEEYINKNKISEIIKETKEKADNIKKILDKFKEIDYKIQESNELLEYNKDLYDYKLIKMSSVDEKQNEILKRINVQEKKKETIKKQRKETIDENKIYLDRLKELKDNSYSCNNTIFIPIIDAFKNLILEESMFDFTNKYKEPYIFPKDIYIGYFFPTKEVLIEEDYLMNKICTIESFFLKKIENYIFKDFSIFFSDFDDFYNEFKDYEEEYNQDLIEQINNLSIKISIDNNEYKLYIPYNEKDYKEKISNYLKKQKPNKFNIECIQYLLIFFCKNKYRQQYFDKFDDNILNFKDKDEFIKYIENQKEKYEIK